MHLLTNILSLFISISINVLHLHYVAGAYQLLCNQTLQNGAGLIRINKTASLGKVKTKKKLLSTK